ncbi:penicillin-binding protein PBP1A [Streptococcus sp. ZY1909104]|uniref:penicillin-binding protein PBP1A n=1 Tax=Streptococcus sp. ZY1909104 TaxID=3233335 RepID=UPI0014323917|nr:PBP1A family penicillin-binding protein [Streptococcus suis]
MKNPTLKKALLLITNVGIIAFLTTVIIGGLVTLFLIFTAPKLTEDSLTATVSSKIYDKDGALIADLGAEKRSNATTAEIPTDLVNAIVAIEDQRYFSHRGVDVIRIAGSFLNNLRGGRLQGGSTLDQQLIKLTYFSTSAQDQNIKRKIQEAWLALQLERRNTKQEILTYYINKVYMSNGNYGMKTAAKTFYGKELNQLTLPQLALLAGMPQAPNQYDPYTQPETAKARRDLVLGEMLEEKYITAEQHEQAVLSPVTDGLQPLSNAPAYPAYMDNYLKEVINEVEEKTGYNLLTTGMEVYTNVDSAAQQQLWNIYNTDMYVAYPDPTFQVASTVIDVTNGHVVAQLGGRNQNSNSSFGTNQAVETNRDFGSTMKPITDYAPAIEEGIYKSTADTILDAPYNYPGTTTPVYNWDNAYFGNVTLKTAIQSSRNITAIKALQAVGLENSLKFLNKLGIDYPEMFYSNAISSNTTNPDKKYGASSEKMAAAYAAFANGGTYYKPQYVNKIVYTDGTTTEFEPEGSRAMSPETAYMMVDMLKSVLTSGPGTNAAIYGIPQAGKTGTSNYPDDEMKEIIASTPGASYSSVVAPDENFVGFSTKYSMAVWTGYSNRKIPVLDSGMRVATDVYRNMMTYLNPVGTADWEIPDGLYRYGNNVYINGYTGPVYNYYSYSRTTSETSEESSTEPTTSEDTSTENSSDAQSTETGSETGNSSEQPTTPSADSQGQ